MFRGGVSACTQVVTSTPRQSQISFRLNVDACAQVLNATVAVSLRSALESPRPEGASQLFMNSRRVAGYRGTSLIRNAHPPRITIGL